jgi:uncharacterized membrane protein
VSVTWWSIVRAVHVLAAMAFVGGQLVLSLVLVPVLRRDLDEGVRAPVLRAAGRRFGLVTNAVVLPAAVVSGIALAVHRDVGWSTFGEPGYGRLLSTKLAFVVLAVGLAAAHGVTASRRPGRGRGLALAGLASSVAIVVFATALVP